MLLGMIMIVAYIGGHHFFSFYKGGRHVFLWGVLLVATAPPPVEIMNGPLGHYIHVLHQHAIHDTKSCMFMMFGEQRSVDYSRDRAEVSFEACFDSLLLFSSQVILMVVTCTYAKGHWLVNKMLHSLSKRAGYQPVMTAHTTRGVTGIFFWGGKVIFPDFFHGVKCLFPVEKIPSLVDPKQISFIFKSEKHKKKEKKKALTPHLFL